MRPIGKAEIDKMLDGRGRRYPATVYVHFTIARLYRIAAREFYQGTSKSEQAARLRSDTLRYQAGAFRRQVGPACADRHRGKIEEVCHLILRLRDRVPSARTIRRWL
ncbi:hypothetical protein [Bradyrhizobium valentinum]|uniref:Uncharacterized protein n=1 Tax=Bradyrhizobium valentinum TaxID=1518501 RepID=A0A0R3LUC1_9BRAD|nr:hypothetical protein [Bradyrhizobium valentinum]KRR11540.1 hypothetical protein CP49_18060 [Bradyrhizobium valentinum]